MPLCGYIELDAKVVIVGDFADEKQRRYREKHDKRGRRQDFHARQNYKRSVNDLSWREYCGWQVADLVQESSRGG